MEKHAALSRTCVAAFAIAALSAVAAGTAFAQSPKVVAGPSADPSCFAPWAAKTQFFQYAKKPGPYRIALANGFIANTWRIQMIKTAKAYVDQPDVKRTIKEFKVISTGEDLPAQIAAVDNFINSGYDAIIVNALNPAAFTPVVKRANRAGVVIVSFDNVIESDEAVMVNVDQVEIGRQAARFLAKNVKGDTGKIVEVRGPSGNSVDRDRHDGFHEVAKAAGKKWEIVEVVGKWDDGTAQKVVADAIAVHKKFDGIYVQGGSTGAVRALIDAKHPFVPVAGETENGFRKLCAAHAGEGLICASSGTGPGAGRRRGEGRGRGLGGRHGAAIGEAADLLCRASELEGGCRLLSALSDNFFVGNSSPTARSTSRRRRSWANPRRTIDVAGAAGPRDPRRCLATSTTMSDTARQPLLRLEGISKRYGGVRALEDAQFACHAGRIHAVLGENGAGKSTLIKIMAGSCNPMPGSWNSMGRPCASAGRRMPRPPVSRASSRNCR